MGKMKDLWIKQHEEAIEAENKRFNSHLAMFEQMDREMDEWESFKQEELEKEAAEEEKQETITLEEVRKVLAELSRDGYTSKVKELLKNHGANKLSEINPDEYKSILQEAEGIKDGKQ